MNEEPLSDDLVELIRTHFPGEVNEARRILLRYSDCEVDRVRRAILSLAKGRLDLLTHNTEQALADYRDVLYWAEYPDEFAGHEPPGAQTDRK